MSGRGAWRIGGYVADELIGYGASAQVWRGHAGRGREAVALKVLDLSDAAAVRAAKAEAALLSTLDHPNLVRLREVLPDGDSVVLVLELAAGGSLADLLTRRGRLSPGEVIVALSPIAAALAYAHDAGVVHCDVSPANVLFRADGSPLLADLGVARLIGGFDAPRSTLAYVDPGVAAGGVPSDSSDVFMVAATALHALTGAPPWRGDSAAAILDQAAEGEIPGLEQRLAGIPVAVADIVRRGLDPSPAARGSAAEFALDLRHAAAPVPVDLDAGPSPTGRDDAVSSIFYAAVGEFDAVEIDGLAVLDTGGLDVTHVVSPRLEPRASPTSIVVGRVEPRPDQGRVHVPRHAARAAASDPVAVGSAERPVPVVLERPDFHRPGGTDARPALGPSVRVPAAPTTGAGPPQPPLALTHIVRARVRAPEPEQPRRRFGPMPPWTRNAAVAVTVMLLVAGGAVATWLRWPHTGSATSARPAASIGSAVSSGPTGPAGSVRSTAPAGSTALPRSRVATGSTGPEGRSAPTRTGAASLPVPSGHGPPGRTASARTSRASPPNRPSPPSRPSPSSRPSLSVQPTSTPAWPRTDQAWVALLTGLDLRRQAAFAANDPASLTDVYVSGALLDQDRRTLRQVVPPGCHLVGLRTNYRDVRVSAVGAQQAVLTTQAALSASRLECPRRPTRMVAAHGPVSMTLALRPVGQRFLIAEIFMPT